jgi:hypothetical protein
MCPDGSVLEVVAVLYLVEDSQTIFALVLEACAHVHSERRLYHVSDPYHFSVAGLEAQQNAETTQSGPRQAHRAE